MGIGIVGIILLITVSMIFSALPQDAFAGKGDLTVMVTVFDISNPNKHKANVLCQLTLSGDDQVLAAGFSNNGGKIRLTFFSSVIPVDVVVKCFDADSTTSKTLTKKMTRITVSA